MTGIILGISIGYNPLTWLLRTLFFTLDSLIYSLSPIIYKLALKLTNMQILINQEAVLNSIAEGVYSLLAIAMLFRFAFSLLTMLADPEKINDKQQGLGKIAVNAIVTLILIVAVPALFNGAAKLQDVILSPDAPEKSIIGGIFTYNDEYSNVATTDLGTFMAREVFKIFVSKNPEATDAQSVAVVYDEVFTSPELDLGKLGSIMYKSYNTGNILSNNLDTKYSVGYLMIVSTAAGLYLLWIFLTFAIEVAHRSIKLFVLQLISPIAIISYIDPTSASKGIFKKWTDEVVKTYLSLFIRIAVLTVVGTIILNINWGAGIFLDEPFIILFFFLGLFTFLKTGPKMIDTIFGITAKTKEEGFGKSLLGGLVGGAAAGAVGAIAGGISSARHGYGFGTGFRTGGVAGLKSGSKAGFGGKPLGVVAGFGGAVGATAKRYGYATGAENRKKVLEDKRARESDSEFKGIRNAHDYSHFDNDSAAYEDYLRNNNMNTELAAHQAETDITKKKQMRRAHSQQIFSDSLGKEDKKTFNGLVNQADKNKFRADYSKRKAIEATTGKQDRVVANAAIAKIDKAWAARMQENKVNGLGQDISIAQIKYQNALATPGGGAAEKAILDDLILNRSNESAELQYLKSKESDAEKHLTAILDEPDHNAAAVEFKRRDRGNQLND